MVNVREFNNGDHIKFSIGTNGLDTLLAGAFTIVAICKRLSGHTDQGALLDFAAGLSGSRGFFRYQDNSTGNQLNYLRGQFQSPGDGSDFTTSDDWCCIAFRKGTGTTNVTYSKGVKGPASTSWTHILSSGTVDIDGSTCDRIQTIFMEDLSWASRIRVAAFAIFNSNLTDVAVQALDTSYPDILAASPLWAVKFDQDNIATAVTDDIADGDQNALTGSTVITTDDPPNWVYSEGGQLFEPILAGTGSLADQIMAGLISQGFTTGSLADRERARLLAKLTLSEPQNSSLQDLYFLATEPNRLAGLEP